jgi:hypothetical protein
MVAVYTILKISVIIHMQKLHKILNHIPFTASSSAFVISPDLFKIKIDLHVIYQTLDN